MASKTDEIRFTVGDQERLVLIEAGINSISQSMAGLSTKMDNVSDSLSQKIEDEVGDLPCQQHPPECTQEPRLKSLETTRKRWYQAIVAVLVSITVYVVKLFID